MVGSALSKVNEGMEGFGWFFGLEGGRKDCTEGITNLNSSQLSGDVEGCKGKVYIHGRGLGCITGNYIDFRTIVEKFVIRR